MKKLTSAIVASSLVLGLVGTAAADFSPAGVNEAAARMKALGVVKGVETPTGPDLMLNKPITRAELVTIIVRAFGKEDLAKLLKGSPAFSDSANHWASGEIAMAKNIIESKGHTLGVTPTTFVPNKEVSSAEAIAFVMKFLGVKENSTLSWPMNFIQGAVDAGLITEADKATLSVAPNSPAIRGLVFYLADHAFSTYKLADTGKSVYTSYVDTAAPVVSVDKFEATTEAKSVTLTGKVSGHKVLHVSTTAGNTSAAVEADLDGTWSATLDLKVGDNTVWIHAVDVAGNVAMAEGVTITRVAGAAAKVEATLSAQLLKAGEAADLGVKVFDANGVEIKDAAYDVTVEGEIGTYADGKFTAATKPATGKITIAAGEAEVITLDVAVVAGALAKINVAGASNLVIGQAVTFTATGSDEFGNEVALTGATWSTSGGGVINPATGEFAGTTSGTATITAKVGDISGSTNVNVFGGAAALKFGAAPSIVQNNTSTATVEIKVVDATGNIVGTSDATVTLSNNSNANIKIVDGDNLVNSKSVKAVNGVATFTVKGAAGVFTASTATLSATAGNLTGDLLTVTSTAPVATNVQLKVTASQLAAVAAGASSTTVTATLKDASGATINNTGSTAITVKVKVSDKTYASFSNSAADEDVDITIAAGANNGTAPIYATAVPGDVTLTGEATNLTVGSAALSTRIAGDVTKLVITTQAEASGAANTAATLKIAAQDALGTTKTTYTEAGAVDVYVVDKDGNRVDADTNTLGTQPAVDELAITNGVATVTVPAAQLQTAGNYTFEVVYDGATPAGVSSTVAKVVSNSYAVTPGAVASVVLDSVSPKFIPANASSTTTVSFKLVDTYGNTVTSATNSMTFERQAGGTASTALPSTLTVTPVNGVGSIVVTAGVVEGADTFLVTVKDANNAEITGSKNATPVSATVNTLIVGPAAGMRFDAATTNLGAAVKAGSTNNVKVYVVDGNARPVSTNNGLGVTLEVYESNGTTLLTTLSASTENGVATFPLQLTAAKADLKFKAKATINGVAVTLDATTDGTNKAISVAGATPAAANVTLTAFDVVAADPVIVKITAPNASMETSGNGVTSAQTLTLKAYDTYSNEVAIASVADAEIALNTGALAALSGGGATVTTKTLTAATGGEALTISDADGVQLNGSTTTTPVEAKAVTVYVAGPAYRLGLVEAPAFTAGANATVKVGVYDGANQLKTAYTGNLTLTATAVPTGAALVPTTDTYTVAVSNGVATFTVPGAKVNKIGTYTFKAYGTNAQAASANFADLTGLAVTSNFGTANDVAFDMPANLQADGSSVGLLTAKVVDANGNTVGDYSGTMNFKVVSGATATLRSVSAPIVNGVAQIYVQATGLAGVTNIEAKVGDSTTLVQAENLTIVPQVAKTIVASAVATTVANSGTTTVMAVVRDVNGNPVQGATVTFSSAAGGAISAVNGTTNAQGIATATFTGDAALDGAVVVTATLTHAQGSVDITDVTNTVTVNVQ